MEACQEVTIRPAIGWNESHARFLAPAISCDPGATVETLKRLVKKRQAQLFEVLAGSYVVACYVLQIEQRDNGAEGVIVAAGGKLQGVSLLRTVLPHIERQFIGCRWLRVETARKGILRELGKYGFQPKQVLMLKELNNG